jgi:hypothetical protein
MSDVFTKAKRSEVMSRIRSRGSESLEEKVVAADAEVFDDVGDDVAGHVARMPRERDEAVGTEGRVKGGVKPRGGHAPLRGFQPHAVGNIEHSTSNIQHPTSNRRQKGESSGIVKNPKSFLE